ncbi:MAG: type I restriction enzyme HsdR N-terminal domain-containing protein [Muribaculaceae bacterium]|nr:type I restriction enzyme HsdR N-terminal domain-containing protein [Muribaculaceae bacterium]
MQLNLPKYDTDLRRLPDGSLQIFDTLRRKYVALTPEEWVRQHFVHWLMADKHYPASLMANEVGLRLNGTLRRCDTVVYGMDMRPVLLVEYKAPEVTVTEKVFEQIARYNLVMGARYLVVSNGLRHYCCRYEHAAGSYSYLREVPAWEEVRTTV